MKTKATKDPDEIRSQADDAFERGDFEAARSLYRQLAGNAFTRADLGDLISAEKHSMRLLLRSIWQETGLWFVGSALADLVAPDDEALQILSEILLDGNLEPQERWRIQCKKVGAAFDRGPHRAELPPCTSWTGVVEDFLAAWSYVEELGEAGSPLRQGMAQMLVRAHGTNVRDFLSALGSHPGTPSTLRALVQRKTEELDVAAFVA